MPKLLILLVLLLTSCTSYDNYRLVELTSLTSPSVTVLEVWDSPYGWQHDGLVLERHIFSGSSVLGQIAGPASIAYASGELSNETNVQVQGQTDVKVQTGRDEHIDHGHHGGGH